MKTVLDAIKDINQSIPGKVTPAETGELLSLTELPLDELHQELAQLYQLKKITCKQILSTSRESYGKPTDFSVIVAT